MTLDHVLFEKKIKTVSKWLKIFLGSLSLGSQIGRLRINWSENLELFTKTQCLGALRGTKSNARFSFKRRATLTWRQATARATMLFAIILFPYFWLFFILFLIIIYFSVLIYSPQIVWLSYDFEGVRIVLDTHYSSYFLAIIHKIFIPLLYYFVLFVLWLLLYIMTYDLVPSIPNINQSASWCESFDDTIVQAKDKRMICLL